MRGLWSQLRQRVQDDRGNELSDIPPRFALGERSHCLRGVASFDALQPMQQRSIFPIAAMVMCTCAFCIIGISDVSFDVGKYPLPRPTISMNAKSQSVDVLPAHY